MVTESPTPSSPVASSVFYRLPRKTYLKAVRASGMYIEDASGKQYLDMSGGAAVSIIGHTHPGVVAAIRDQAAALDFAHTSFFTNGPQEELAARLAGRFGAPGARVYFTSGGSEANETALKLCWQYWAARGEPQRKIIVSREHSYHGNTLGGLSVSGNEARRRASAAPLLDWPRISPCYPYRGQRPGEDLESYATRVADELEQAIMQAGPEKVAAFICEPIVGASLGAVAAAPGYLERIRAICDRHGVLWIADEIMCGSGRTGRFFAFEQDGMVPDIVTLAKGLGGGFQPLAATILNQRVGDILENSGFAHGHTYVGHPICCAAGVAVQNVMEHDRLLERAQVKGRAFADLLRERFGDHPHVGDIRGRGLFWGIELVADRQTRSGFSARPGLAGQLLDLAVEAGLVVYPGSIEVDGACVPHITLAPPLILDDVHMEECAEKLSIVLGRAFGA